MADSRTGDVRRELGGEDVPNAQYAAVFAAIEKGGSFHALDVIDTLWWKIRNQRREITRLNGVLQLQRAALRGLLPAGWDDGTMDHMPGVKAARLALESRDPP